MASVYFRVDGNNDIATGHIMRCLTIARACRQAGNQHNRKIQILFLVSDDTSRSLLEERFEIPEEFTIYSLNSNYRQLNEETPVLLSLIADTANTFLDTSCGIVPKKPWLFIDSYYATSDYFRRLTASCRLAYLDDLRSFACPVDLLINYDTEEDCSYYAQAAHRLLGMQYTPLREQFKTQSYTVRPEVSHVLLSTGGTDPYGVAEYLLRMIYGDTNCFEPLRITSPAEPSKPMAISRLQSLHYHVVTSSTNTRYEDLCILSRENPHIHIHENVTDMASLMASCDLAVSAGGTTLSELCAIGVPSISYLMADNQRTAVERFAARGIIPCAGDIRPVPAKDTLKASPGNADTDVSDNLLPASVISGILQFMTNMSSNFELRKKSSHAMRAFLDGNGAGRIAEIMLADM